MLETPDEIATLQELLDASRASATAHLRNIIDDDRALTARDLVELLTGMRVLSVATVPAAGEPRTRAGEPRIRALAGHCLHWTWTFITDGSSAKAQHMRARPAVSVAHIDGEE